MLVYECLMIMLMLCKSSYARLTPEVLQPREVTEHALRLIPGSKPAKQRLRHFDDERRRAIGKEIAKLLTAGFIREVFHSD